MYSEDIFSALKPLYYFSKIVGLAPYEIARGFNKKEKTVMKVSRNGIIYSVFMICVNIVAFAAALMWEMNNYYTKVSKSVMASNILYWVFTLATTISGLLLQGVIYRNKLVNILSTIQSFDNDFFNGYKSYERTLICIIIEVVVYFIIFMVLSFYDMWVRMHIIGYEINYLGIYLFCLINFAVALQFLNLVKFVHDRLSILNERISRLIKNCSNLSENNSNASQKIFTIVTKNTTNTLAFQKFRRSDNGILTGRKTRNETYILEKLRTLRKQQNTLRNLANAVNKTYGIQIFLQITTTFIDITCNLYFSLQFAFLEEHSDKHSISDDKHVFCTKLGWSVVMAFKVFCIATLCHITTAEASRTGDLLQHHLLPPPTDIDLTLEIQFFLQQVISSPLRFTAYGFFDLDRSVICSFVGGVTTYLIVLLQFH